MSNPSSNQVFLYSNSGTLLRTFTNTDGTAIQDAITAASSGDTIQIGGGTYNENVDVTVSGLTIENVAGQQVTILGQGGYAGALNVTTGVFGVTIKSSDGIAGNFVVEGSPTSPQLTALYIVGNNDDIKINGITTIAPVIGDAGLNSVVTGGNLNNVLFENNVFAGNADQLVYVNGAEDYGPSAQDGFVSFVGNTFSGSASAPGGALLGMDAPGEIINNKFTGTGAVDVGLGEAGVTVTGNTFNNSPTEGYFFGNGAYDPQAIQNNNSFPNQSEIYIIQNGVRQDGVYTSIQAAINAAVAGDTVFVGIGTYSGFTLANGVNVEGQARTGVVVNGTITTPANFDNTTVSNLTVNGTLLLDMTQTTEVDDSVFQNITFNLTANYSAGNAPIGNGQVSGSIAINDSNNDGAGLTFSGVTMNSNNHTISSPTQTLVYTLFHTNGDAQMVLNGVSLNGTASGSSSGLGAQWNMSPNSSETAEVTIENSSTSGGGNFYVSGMDSATITDNVFNGQGLALNGVTNGSVTGNTFENIDGTYTANGTQNRGLVIENAFGATGDSNISVTGNTFQNISVADGAIAFQRFNENLAGGPATIAQLNGINIQGNTFTNVTNAPIYLNSTFFGANAVLPASISDSQLILGTSGNDSITAPATSNTDIFGGGGVDTLTDTGVKTSDFSVVNGLWTITSGTVVDTLNNIDKITDGSGNTFLLVGDGAYQTIQDAVNAATAGETILVAPGTYNEQVTVGGTGLNGLTIEGVGSGVNVDAPTAPGSLRETAVSPTSGNAIDGIFTVNGANSVTISGLTVDGLGEGYDTYFAPSQPGEASLVGIAYINTTLGSINGVTVENTDESDGGIGDQRNFGILVVNNTTLAGDIPTTSEAAALNTISITGSAIESFQKNGITVEYADATISGNTLTGLGPIDNAQNAIEIGESTGSVSNNVITDVGYIGAVAATGVLAFFDQGLNITGNNFTGASGSDPLSPVGVYVLDSANGEITNNTSTNVDNGVAFLSDAFGADSTGTWTVTGNTATNVVSVANGGNGIFFDSDPTNSNSSFTVDDSGSNTSDAFYLTPGTDTLTGGDAGNNSFVVLEGTDLGAGDTINGGKGIGNTIDFASGTTGDTLTIGSNVTNVQDVDVVGPTFASTDTTQLNVNATSATNGLTITGNNGGDTITGTAHFNDTLIGGTGNDTFIVGTGNDTINGGGGLNTVESFGADFSISISGGHWVVSNGTTTDTLSGIEDVVIAGKTYELVDTFGTSGGFQSLQTAIDSAATGDTILVAPGKYTESANYDPITGQDDTINGTNPVGLLIDRSVTIKGVNGSGGVITSASNTQATIISSIESDWGTNFYITAPNVAISGLTFQASDEEYGQNPENQGIVNKAIEDVANNFTLENSLVDAASGVPLGSSVYIDDPGATTNPNFVSSITQYNVTGNILDGDFVESSGVGFGLPSANLSLQFTNNEFSLNAGTTADTYAQEDGGYANDSVILNGDLYPEVGWDLAPVAAPTISGNTVDSDYTESPTGARFFAADNSAANLPGLSYIQNYVANNNLGTYAYVLTSGGALEIPSFGGYSSYEIYLDAGDATAPATANAPDGANSGDTVIVQSGADSSVQTIGTNNLTIKALSGSTALDLSLGSGVTSITLADYSAGHGANVTVTGNGAGDTITGNDGNDTLTGGTGNDTFNLGSGSNTVTGDGGLDTVHFTATLTSADFSFSNNEWAVTNGAATDDLSGISIVTDGAGDTFLLVGAGGQYSTPNAAFTSTQHTSNSVHVIDTPAQDGTPAVTVNNGQLIVDKAGAAAVAFSVSNLDDDESGTLTFSDGNGHMVTVQVEQGTANRFFLNNVPVSTVSLTGLNDGTVTATLSVTDTAGNFDSVTNSSVTLETTSPTLSTPTIGGSAQEGQTLTASSTAGQSDDTLSFAWYSSADKFTTAIGFGSTYLIKQTDEGQTIEVKATATNANGLNTLSSMPTGTVIAAFPTVTAPVVPNAASNQTFTASQLFSASDPDSTPILSYEVGDESTGASNGFWTLNGVVEPDGSVFTVTTAQLSGLSFTAGTNTSGTVTDTLEVAASDVAGFGAFTSFTVTAAAHAPTTAPTVTASSETVLPESNLAASSLFSGTAFGNNSIVGYEVEDTTSNSGSWIFEPVNQVIDVTTAQLSELSFQTGFGTDTLKVRANDGTQWGNYTTFTISPKANAAPPAGTSTVLDMEQTATGVYEYYDIGRSSILQAGPLDQISTSLSVVGIGGFDGSDTADLLTRNTSTGAFTLLDVSNNNVTGSISMGQVGLEWQVAGFGDFSGNSGETDMLMRDTNTGQLEVYDIRNNGITGFASMGQVGLEWQVAGFGDFSTNAGETDMLMRNANTGQFEVYDISHNQLVGFAPLGQVGTEWKVLGFGDFSGNANETDMLMQNTNSGAFEVYDIRNNQIVSAGGMGQVGFQWTVAGFADFSGNANETDLLMRNSASGAFELFDISKNAITSASAIGSVGMEWKVTGVAADPPPSAAASTVLSGQTNDPASGASISQLTQAMASMAPSAGASTATSPLGQSPMLAADVLATTMQNNPSV